MPTPSQNIKPFQCEPSNRRDARFPGVSARPLYPVAVFRDTAVDRVSHYARFGGYLFAGTPQGWRLVLDHTAD